MSWTKPTDAIEQMRMREGGDNGGNDTASFPFKGPFNALETAMKALRVGDVIKTGWLASRWDLTRISADWGELTIECTPPDPTSGGGGGGGGEVLPLEDLWTIQSCRNDVSVWAYCGPSQGAHADRAQIELWLKETDPGLVSAFCYRDSKREVQELSNPSIAVAKKLAAGVQSVMRFYPLLTRTRVYSGQPPKCLENLGFIDTPPNPGTDAKNPGGVDTAIDAHQWLKCRDDVAQRSDRKWTRTEAWMGIAKSDGAGNSPWDPDLYGPNRWSMPAEITQP